MPNLMMANREVRRVPLDFDWPLNEVWKGYINPIYKEPDISCPDADCRDGYTSTGYWFESVIATHVLLAGHDSATGKAHPWRLEWLVYPGDVVPGSDLPKLLAKLCKGTGKPVENIVTNIVGAAGLDPLEWGFDGNGKETSARVMLGRVAEFIASGGNVKPEVIPVVSGDIMPLCTGLTGREMDPFFGADGLDRYRAPKTIAKYIKLPARWSTCPVCKGTAGNPKYRDAIKRWRSFGPPKGNGYQLWETTSEGSPASPVFETMDGLLDHLDGKIVFGNRRASRAEWKRVLEDDPAIPAG